MKLQIALRWLYYLLMVALAASLPLSHFCIGLFSFALLLVWIAQGDWRGKWARIRRNRSVLWFSGLYVVCCLGLITTQHWNVAAERLLSGLPLLLTPIVVGSSKPFSKRAYHIVFFAFVTATLFGIASSLVYWMTHTVNDIRQISIFIDHIRFSLCVVFSILFSSHLLLRNFEVLSPLKRFLCVAVIAILMAYLFVAQTLSGIVAVVVVALVYVLVMAFRAREQWLKWLLRGILLLQVALVSYIGVITYQFFHDQDSEVSQRVTAMGNPYEFDDNTVIENGHRIGFYVCREELRAAWTLRSDTNYTPMLEQTLIRYLNSKGLHKDYAAVMLLKDNEIQCVERGIANAAYVRVLGLKRALYPTYFSVSLYCNNNYIDNSSLMERVELWNASWRVIRDNWWLGAGLGDYKIALDDQLDKQGSTIAYKHNRGSHNQWLTYWLMGGVAVVLFFMLALLMPPLQNRNRISFLYVACLLVLIVSMLVEDTLESQTGRMLFALFLPLMLVRADEETVHTAAHSHTFQDCTAS